MHYRCYHVPAFGEVHANAVFFASNLSDDSHLGRSWSFRSGILAVGASLRGIMGAEEVCDFNLRVVDMRRIILHRQLALAPCSAVAAWNWEFDAESGSASLLVVRPAMALHHLLAAFEAKDFA